MSKRFRRNVSKIIENVHIIQFLLSSKTRQKNLCDIGTKNQRKILQYQISQFVQTFRKKFTNKVALLHFQNYHNCLFVCIWAVQKSITLRLCFITEIVSFLAVNNLLSPNGLSCKSIFKSRVVFFLLFFSSFALS